MLVYEKNTITEDIEKLVDMHGSDRSALLPVLQAVQKKYRYVSEFAQQEIARLLDIHPVEVFSVISFYSFLHSEPQGRNIVRLCRTIVCDMAGREEVEKAVMRELKIDIGETTKDKKITLEHTNCLGMCDQGPAMMVNDKIYTKLTPEKAVEILKKV
ncbi:MAG: NADH-quinone oxidoreductase subunit NuoE [Ignavibacteria bacterium]|jgi:NADH:ubiquinone oxidoreductase subunit E|nr:NADH-quinone oxidoreductase subunit NuoE [Ignavibacteria bacterium]